MQMRQALLRISHFRTFPAIPSSCALCLEPQQNCKRSREHAATLYSPPTVNPTSLPRSLGAQVSTSLAGLNMMIISVPELVYRKCNLILPQSKCSNESRASYSVSIRWMSCRWGLPPPPCIQRCDASNHKIDTGTDRYYFEQSHMNVRATRHGGSCLVLARASSLSSLFCTCRTFNPDVSPLGLYA